MKTPIHPPPSFVEFRKDEIEQSIPARFGQQVQQYPTRLAVKTRQRAFTYEGLNRAANRIAQTILARCGSGVQPVGLLLEPDAMSVAAVLGVLKAGKIWLPLNPAFPPARLNYILADTQASLIITADSHLLLADELRPTAQPINIDQLDPALATENVNVPLTPNHLAYIIYTSGSTGQPKGVVQNHRNVLHSIRHHTNSLCICADDRLSLLSAYSFLAGVTSMLRALLNGAAVLPFNLRREGLAQLAQWLRQEEITIYQSVPTVFRHLVDTFSGDETFPKLRLIHLGGEPVSRHDVELYKKYFAPDCVLLHNLGSTEVSTYRQYFIDRHTQLTSNLAPVGYAVEDKEVLLLDEAGQPVGFGEVGEIAVKSRYMTPGYWGQPELTQAVFSLVPGEPGERIYRTGDLGCMQPDGCLIHVGRKDAQVKIRGQRVELAEIEMVLLEYPDIKEVAVVVHENEQGDKQLVAYIVPGRAEEPGSGGVGERRSGGAESEESSHIIQTPKPETRNSKLETLNPELETLNPEPETRNSLRHFLQQRLPDYMLPATFTSLEALPLLPNGKIDRRALQELASIRPGLDRPLTLSRDPLEQQLTELWEQLLDIRPIGVHDNFFELGGHSLLALRLLTQIKQRFDRDLPPTALLWAPTIEKMACLLRQEGNITAWSSLVTLQPHGSKPPLFCLPGNLGNVFTDLGYLVRWLGSDQPVYGLQDGPHVPAQIKALASHYLGEIQAVQPAGPYLLAGICAGGMVAFEMAHQLQAQGQPVALLALIEPAPPRGPSLHSYLDFVVLMFRRFLRRFRHHSENLVQLDPGQHRRYARLKLKLFANSWALRHYTPRPYPGHLHLFLTQASLQAPANPQLGWRNLATQGTEIHALPGHHDTLTGNNDTQIEEAYMQILARQLDRCINTVLTNLYPQLLIL